MSFLQYYTFIVVIIFVTCLIDNSESFLLKGPTKNQFRIQIPKSSLSSFKQPNRISSIAFTSLSSRNDDTDITTRTAASNSPQSKTKNRRLRSLTNIMKYILPVLLLTCIPLMSHASSFQESITGLTKAANDSGFVQSFLLIFISEIGDKTFFIAALLAAKYGKILSFLGSMSALAVMTVISTVLGQVFHAVPTSISQGIPFDDYVAIVAFSYFGLKTLYDASKMTDNSGLEEEFEEAEESVAKIDKKDSLVTLFIQIFSLVFAAEIGDRSFLSTIALSAALNPYAVAVGAIAAHGTATGVAVIGGDFLSKYLSEKVIGYIGGTLFIVFAITTAFGIF